MKLVIDWEGVEPGTYAHGSTIESIVHKFDQCFQLMVRKDSQYGAAWREQGYMGQTARILSKCSRLRRMTWRSIPEEHSDESTVETVMDLVNLGIFWLINKDQERRWGRDEAGR